MGLCASCCRPSASEVITPDAETRRRQQTMAAERRIAEQESRGIKDVGKFKRNQKRSEDLERMERNPDMSGQKNLRWTQN